MIVHGGMRAYTTVRKNTPKVGLSLNHTNGKETARSRRRWARASTPRIYDTNIPNYVIRNHQGKKHSFEAQISGRRRPTLEWYVVPRLFGVNFTCLGMSDLRGASHAWLGIRNGDPTNLWYRPDAGPILASTGPASNRHSCCVDDNLVMAGVSLLPVKWHVGGQ